MRELVGLGACGVQLHTSNAILCKHGWIKYYISFKISPHMKG